MSDNLPSKPPGAAVAKKKRRKTFRLKIDMEHSLKRAAFDPIYQLTTNVYPKLEPEGQADVIKFILPYVYCPAAKSQKPTKKGKGIQVNTQVNVPQQISEDTLKQLRELAKGESDDDDDK